MKTEEINWRTPQARGDRYQKFADGFVLPDWEDYLTVAEVTDPILLRVKISRERLAQAAPAFPGYVPQKPVKRRGRNAHKVGEAIDRGTAETRAKLKADQVQTLFRRGTLDKVHVEAAERIAAVREALGRGLAPGAAQIGDRVQGGGAFRDPLQRMSEREGRWWLGEYRPWLADLVSDPICRVTKTKRQVFNCSIGFTMAVVVENWCLADAEDYCRIPRNMGVGAVLLRIALDRYALIAGLRNGAKVNEIAAFEKAS